MPSSGTIYRCAGKGPAQIGTRRRGYMNRVRVAIVIAVAAAGLCIGTGSALASSSTVGGASLPAFHCDFSSLSGTGTVTCTAGDLSASCVLNLWTRTLNCSTAAGDTLACTVNLLARTV